MGFLKRRFFRLLRWTLFSVLLRKFLKSKASKSAQRAADELQEKLPPSVASAVESLPPRVKAATGSAIIAGRSIKRVASAATGADEPHVFKRRLQQQRDRITSRREVPVEAEGHSQVQQ